MKGTLQSSGKKPKLLQIAALIFVKPHARLPGSALPRAQSPVPHNDTFLIVEGVCADEPLQLDTLTFLCRGRHLWEAKLHEKGRRVGCFEEAVIYGTINSPGITGLAQTQHLSPCDALWLCHQQLKENCGEVLALVPCFAAVQWDDQQRALVFNSPSRGYPMF